MSMSMDMDMDMSSNTTALMGMDSMAMNFFSATTTPLFSMSWAPNSIGAYAGTCIFLIFFAVLLRALVVFRVNIHNVPFLGLQNVGKQSGIIGADAEKTPSWRAYDAVVLSSLDVLVAGFGYLLMVAVMTMNVGYFVSVLSGVFLGGMVLSRYTSTATFHC